MLALLSAVAATGGAACFLHEKSLRRTRPMTGGLHPEITLPVSQDFELWHNAFSLCSKKVRLCLAELGIDYASRPVDLIETGSYETLSRRFLAVNPAALVPVLVHRGHPVYESHEILRYAAAHATNGVRLVPEDPAKQQEMQRWIDRSSLVGDDPVEGIAESAGNCIPGLTIPLFATMIAHIPASRIVEGLFFHRLKKRPAFFLALKIAGPARLPSLRPVVEVIHRSRREMLRHLDGFEAQLARSGPWIVGDEFTLADVSWAVIFDRLREADWTDLLESPSRPLLSGWWSRMRARPSYAASMLGELAHPLVTRGTAEIRELETRAPHWRAAIYTKNGV